MCACDVGFTCRQCAGTPYDPRYLEDAYEPMSPAEFDVLVAEWRSDDGWTERLWSA